MGGKGGNTPDSYLSHKAHVEDILGVPLLPQTIPYDIVPDAERPDIRVRVHDAVLGVVRKVAGKEVLNPETPLTDEHREKVAGRAGELIVQGRRQVIIANNVAESVSRPAFVPPGADAPDTPRALLQTTMGKVLFDFIQRPHPPKIPGAHKGLLGPLRSGLIVASATATGKTVPVAETAQRAGVGKPYAAVDPALNKILIVVPSVRLLKAYMDPDETLRRWLPDIEFTDFWHGAHNVGGAAQIVLDESLEMGIESRAIRLEEYPIRAVDEGHHAGEPAMRKLLTSLATGRLILCTATPREMGRYFSDFTASRARSAAEQGITRPVRLYTYLHGPKAGDAEQTTALVAAQVIRAGRKVGIYCRALRGSEEAQQARTIAALINKYLEEEGKEGKEYVKVIATASGAEANEQAETEFREGILAGYAVIGMFTEGVNIPLDALIIVGGRPLKSQWMVDQIAGRLPRPIFGRGDAQHPGWLIEVNPREIARDNPIASIWRTYDYDVGDVIEQGVLIGETPIEDDEESMWWMEPPSSGGSASPGAPRSTSGSPGTVVGDEDLVDIRQFLAPPLPLREITVAPEDWTLFEGPPEGSKPLSELAGRFRVPEVWLRRQLDQLSQREDLTILMDLPEGKGQQSVPVQIRYVGVRDTSNADNEKRWEFERWYSPETVKYLEQHPPTSLPEAGLMDITDIADMCEVDRHHIESIIGTFSPKELPSLERLGKINRPTKHFRLREVGKIVAKVEATPIADPETEVALFDLGQELDESFVYTFARIARNNITVHERRRHPSSGITGFARHISAADADRIRDAYYNPPIAGGDEMSLVELARRARVDIGAVTRYIASLPEEEQPFTAMRIGSRGRMAEHIKKEAGHLLIEKLRPRKLLPNQVTLTMLANYFKAGKNALKIQIGELAKEGYLTQEEATPEVINLSGHGARSSVWTWKAMKMLELYGSFRRRPDVDPIDYELVARGPFDIRWEYSEQVQSHLVDPKQLLRLPGRNRLQRLEDKTKLPHGAMPLDYYATSRQVDKANLLEVIARGEAGEIVLYYNDDDDPGNPFFVLEGNDVGRLDRVYEYEPPKPAGSEVKRTPAEPQPAAAKVVPPKTTPVASGSEAKVTEATAEVQALKPAAESGERAVPPAVTFVAPAPAPQAAPAKAAPLPPEQEPSAATTPPLPPVAPPTVSAVSTEVATDQAAEPQDEGDGWTGADDVRSMTNCDPYAFQVLVQMADIPAKDIRRDDTGAAISFSPHGTEVMRNYRIGPPPQGWSRLAMIASRGGRSPIELAFEALLLFQEKRGSAFTEREVTVGRNGLIVELYVEATIARRIQQILKKESDQAILDGRKRAKRVGSPDPTGRGF